MILKSQIENKGKQEMGSKNELSGEEGFEPRLKTHRRKGWGYWVGEVREDSNRR